MKKKLMVLFSVLCLILPAMIPVMAEEYQDVSDYFYSESFPDFETYSEKEPDILAEAKKHPDKYEIEITRFGREFFRDGKQELKSVIYVWEKDNIKEVGYNDCDTAVFTGYMRIYEKGDPYNDYVADVPFAVELKMPDFDLAGLSWHQSYTDGEMDRNEYRTNREEDVEAYIEKEGEYPSIPDNGEYRRQIDEIVDASQGGWAWSESNTIWRESFLKYEIEGWEIAHEHEYASFTPEQLDAEIDAMLDTEEIGNYISQFHDRMMLSVNMFDENEQSVNIIPCEKVVKGDTILFNYSYEGTASSYESEEGPVYDFVTTESAENNIKQTLVIKKLPIPGTFVYYIVRYFDEEFIRNGFHSQQLTDRQLQMRAEAEAEAAHKRELFDQFLNITPTVKYHEPIYDQQFKEDENEEDVIIDVDAHHDPDQQNRNNIMTGIIVGAAGLLAAGLAAGASQSEKTDGDHPVYQLVVDKDFGNRLRKGDKQRELRAWIEKKATDGNTYLRNDLSCNITFESGQYIQVTESYDVQGKAAVQLVVGRGIPDEVKEDHISIIYSGKGGTFTERLHFKIVGDPYITFPERNPSAMMMNVFAIGGDHATYKVAFTIEDAVEQPSEIRFDCDEPGLDIKIEHLEEYTYDVVLVNNTEEITDRVYETEKRCFIELTAVFEGENAVNGFNFCLVPEGLSVKGTCKDGQLQLRSYENEGAGAMDPKIKPTEFRPVLAVSELYDDGQKRTTFVDIDDTEVKAGLLKEGNELSRNLLEKYEYEIDTERRSVISFIPKKHIPSFYPAEDWEKQSPEDYPVMIPLTVSWEGKDYTTEVPCLLVGEKLRRMDVRKEEYLRVVSIITRYVPYEDQDLMFKKLSYMMKYRSVAELRVIEKQLLANAVEYYTQQSKDYIALEERLAWWQDKVELIKTINDAAFSMVVARMTSDVAEIFITPAKDILFEAMGALSVEYFQGEPFDIEKLPVFDNVAKVGENLISKELDIYKGFTADKNTWKKALSVVAGYMAYMAIKNYLETVRNDKPDLIGSILKTFSDLTGTVVKGYILGSMKKYVTTQAFKDKMNSIFEKYVKQTFAEKYLKGALETVLNDETYADTSERTQKFLDECYDKDGHFLESHFELWKASNSDYGFISGWDTLQKFLDEMLGRGIGSVQSTVGQSVSTKDDHLQVKFPFSEDVMIDIDLTGFCNSINTGISNAATYVIDLIFGDVPSETEKKEYPEDIPVAMK